MSPTAIGKEFRDFLLKTNMFALAMGVVIGTAANEVVNGIVADLVMPFAGAVNKEGSWRSLSLDVWRFKFTYGHLVGTILNFLIIAAVVFLLTKLFIKQSPPPPVKECPKCREGIHPEATRCKFCTSEI